MILRNAHYETKENEVAASDSEPVDGAYFERTLASASPDVLREMLRKVRAEDDADVGLRATLATAK